MINPIDIGILVGYFVIVFLIGIYFARKESSTGEELFLGGRSFTWGFIGLSLFASNISTSTIIGLSGEAYKSGIPNSVYEWMTGIPLFIAAMVFIPIYLRTKITTIPEFLEKRYDRRSQIFFSTETVVASILVETSGGLYAGSKVMQNFFPQIELWQSCFLIATLAGIYTAFGGLKAVVYTDALQAIILIIGCSILAYLMFAEYDFSFEAVKSEFNPNHFKVLKPINDKSLPWPGIFIGVQLMGFWYWTTNQYIVQRVLGAKNIQHARWGAALAGFLKIIPLFIIVFPGAMAAGLLPGLEDSEKVFPTMVTQILPVGVVGLVLAALVSAIMSSVDSTLNSSSTLIVVDFIKPMKKNITEKQVIQYSRITTFVLMVFAAAWAPVIDNFEGIWEYLQKMYAIFVPPVVVVFLVGVFFKRAHGTASFITLTFGTLLGLFMFLLELKGYWTIHFTITVGFIILICALIFILSSYLMEENKIKNIDPYIFEKQLIYEKEGTPLFQNYLFLMSILISVILGILIWLG